MTIFEIDVHDPSLEGQRIDESPFSTSTTDNWVARLGGLPPYIRGVTRGIMKSGHSFEDALKIAIGVMKTWAAGGPTYGHKSHATASTIAKAGAALAHWEAMKAAAHSNREDTSWMDFIPMTDEELAIDFTFRDETTANAPLIEVSGVRTGAYGPGHAFHGNQHTGSLGTGRKVITSRQGMKQAGAQAKQKGDKAAAQISHGGLDTKGAASEAAGIVANANSGQMPGTSVPSSAASAAAAKAQAAAAAQQQLLNAVDSATATYNKARDSASVASDNAKSTQSQEGQNLAFATAKVHMTANAQTNEQNQDKLTAVKTSGDVADQHAAEAAKTAKDNLAMAEVGLWHSMKAAGYRDIGEEYDPSIGPLLEEFATRAAFVGEGNPAGVGDTSGASNFLPAGPSQKEDDDIHKKLTKGVHQFKGTDLQHCEATNCGRPITDPVHRVVAETGGVKTGVINNMSALRVTGTSLRADAGWHSFVGEDLMACGECGESIVAPQHRPHPLEADSDAPPIILSTKIPQLDAPPAVAAPGLNETVAPPIVRSGTVTVTEDQPVRRTAEVHLRDAAYEAVHTVNVRNFGLVEEPLEAALAAHFEEQRRATVNRLFGRRGGRMLKRAVESARYPQLPRDDEEVSTSHSDTPAGDPVLDPSKIKDQLDEPNEEAINVDPGDIFDRSFWTAKLTTVLEPHMAHASSLGQGELKRQVDVPRDLDDQQGIGEARIATNRSALTSAQAVITTTAKQLTRALQAGVARRESRDEIRARIDHVFDVASSQRAALITRNAVVSAYNGGQVAYAGSLPVLLNKTWLADSGDETRADHRAADGQTRAARDPFTIGDGAMDHPGDATADPSEWMNDRCSLAWSRG